MPHDRLRTALAAELAQLDADGRRKSQETVITGVVPPQSGKGPRYLLAGEGDRRFLRMNSNSYLGLSLRAELAAAEDAAIRDLGTGPGAVRFISGTWAPHVELERRLAGFHGREAAMIFSSAYATVMGVLPPLVTAETMIISDELNHNCIINATRLARPLAKRIYRHLNLAELERQLADPPAGCRRALVVSDGVFSMRGDHAPINRIIELACNYDAAYPENVLVVVDDSHGVGALGATGRGTEEQVGGGAADLLVATLGKALGVNGGYVTGTRTVIDYLRETSPFYIYSNPITPGEAAAACRALELLDGPEGRALLAHLRQMTARFSQGLIDRGLETIDGEHPVVPLMLRDTARTAAIVDHLKRCGILATAITYPVVPRGEEEIRFQISADHTSADVDEALAALGDLPAAN